MLVQDFFLLRKCRTPSDTLGQEKARFSHFVGRSLPGARALGAPRLSGGIRRQGRRHRHARRQRLGAQRGRGGDRGRAARAGVPAGPPGQRRGAVDRLLPPEGVEALRRLPVQPGRRRPPADLLPALPRRLPPETQDRALGTRVVPDPALPTGPQPRAGRRLPRGRGSGPLLLGGPPSAEGQPPVPARGLGGVGLRVAAAARPHPPEPVRLGGRVPRPGAPGRRVLPPALAGSPVLPAVCPPLRPHPVLPRRGHQDPPEAPARAGQTAQAAAGRAPVTVLVVLFTPCFLPSFLARVLVAVFRGAGGCGVLGAMAHVSDVANGLSYLQSLLNPVLYCFSNPAFRYSYRKVFNTLRGRGRETEAPADIRDSYS
ncbi:unnamed protein product [Gulo gulo]|uniref:G-protein coupled receptors family 1 profile domain-containing protein n=1 Tax=Gulo gulo TaxID=48420 RepID=A0A9X9LXH8_GULGU|nr:unnamed protein product [Gulo gulo]